MNSDHHWQEGLEPDADKHFGFIYEMHHLPTGHLYIGRKQYWASSGAVKSRHTNIRTDKWKPHHWKPSDWRTYSSSSKTVKKMLGNILDWEFSIVQQCVCMQDLSYAEPWQMHDRGVGLTRMDDGSLLYLNKHIPDFHGAVSEYYDWQEGHDA